MKKSRIITILACSLLLAGCGQTSSGSANSGEVSPIVVTDMIGRSVTVTPGSYSKVVCIGAGALRMYSYIGDVSLLAGVEDIDNTSLESRPKMFDGVARPYLIANETVFQTLPSCGVGGPQAQTAEAEKILGCDPDIVVSEYEDVDKENALQEQLGVPVITLRYGQKGVWDDAVADSFTMLGRVFARESEATELNGFIDVCKNDISSRAAGVAAEGKKNVYIGGLGNWGTTTHLMTAKNYEPFNVANIKNVCDGDGEQDSGIHAIEEEKFVSLGESMDVMILDAAAIKNIKGNSEYLTDLKGTKAWKDDRIYLQMAYNAYYTNLEMALVNTYYGGKVVYPDLFSDVDMDEITNRVTDAFLGKELATEIKGYDFSYGGYQHIGLEAFFN
ncbi:MAG: ABC transporter substrate-binding protein [Bacilli bacterium]|jgi:iron complex transport system substrate-binding protein|nr:ABC transporter substrate-binding protein [Bacilli bacterium]